MAVCTVGLEIGSSPVRERCDRIVRIGQTKVGIGGGLERCGEHPDVIKGSELIVDDVAIVVVPVELSGLEAEDGASCRDVAALAVVTAWIIMGIRRSLPLASTSAKVSSRLESSRWASVCASFHR